MNHIANIRRTQFIENVLGIDLTIEQSCLLMEGRMPVALKERIEYETRLYEGFVDDLVKKIGAIPTSIQKTFKAATDVLKFIYQVITDPTGKNLKEAITRITRNARALFTRITKAVEQLPAKIKQLLEPIMNWLKTKVPTFFSVKSDVDDQDDLKGDSGNWKKFILLFLGGCVLVMISKIPDILKDFGEDVLKDGLISIFKSTTNITNKLLAEPQVAAAVAGGAAITSLLAPLLKIYAGAQVLETINDVLLDSNAWLKHSTTTK
jgi:hypothetical protein